MTLKQGQEINSKFSSLNDSISRLNSDISKLNNASTKLTEELIDTKSKKIQLDLSLKTAADSLTVSEIEIKRLNAFIKETENSYWREKKTWAGWMFCSVVVTVLVSVIK